MSDEYNGKAATDVLSTSFDRVTHESTCDTHHGELPVDPQILVPYTELPLLSDGHDWEQPRIDEAHLSSLTLNAVGFSTNSSHQVNECLSSGTDGIVYPQQFQEISQPHITGSHTCSSTENSGIPFSVESSAVSVVSNALNVAQQYICTECDEKFAKGHQLNKHMRKHTRPHKCDILGCGRSFAQNRDLKRHKDAKHSINTQGTTALRGVHLCEYPPCNYALRGFSRKDNCDRHMRSQHGRR
ncbi:hypothetical protein EJ05DRAFT_227015 [Pseudovirgaria hyperparasitica]|uniref:C2H2-type domain-containing protein n=1 Tax=Pseudovirgaria hyperparasitica TaxID=470096 RepID=A0A6A6VU62_9PEZI|nr:uncharacterized protein EJ05DRAFT_227015 [Pseudovirgaria hyperparasitica]KAF2753150.1 hypothetical protein EJ05DRAFT_227015 [Pseudovirgaria hyperparasitica]